MISNERENSRKSIKLSSEVYLINFFFAHPRTSDGAEALIV